ncbi:MAG: hypothetical protein HQL36_05040 [Alphaproteobacteria bacterium]|nr:hypothetical protein [Alphaproteobacteria bacterium]MBF0249841.1 hypothetical protein [Alphaproteobacteria bacterium]
MLNISRFLVRGAAVCAFLALSACVTPNDHALKIGGPPVEDGETVSALRQIQSRRFDTLDTERLVKAATATMQDLGFNISATSTDYGVIVGEKDRDAIENDQVAAQVALMVMFALMGSNYQAVYDVSQVINVSMVVNKSGETSSVVRVIFDRHITNNHGHLWKSEVIKDPDIYQQFFAKLEAGAFLEANEI